MMLGSTMAGVAFGYSDVAAVHCIAEALGGRYDTPHGASNAMVLTVVTEFNIPSNTEKYAEVARHLGVDTTGMTTEEAAHSCVDAMKSICELSLIHILSSLGACRHSAYMSLFI